MKFQHLLAILLISNIANAQFDLSPDSLVQLDYTSSPMYLESDASTMDSEARKLESYDDLNWRAEGRVEVSETNERPLIVFQPIFSPVKQASFGVNKKTKYGVDLRAGVGAVSQSFDFQNQRTKRVTTVVEVGADFDLNKNFMGRATKARLAISDLSYRQSQLQTKIQLSRIKNQAQQIYWTLVANRLKKKVADRLKNSAQKQLNEMSDRAKSYLADAGDVASYTYQLAERKALGVSLDYEQTQLEEQLKSMLPQLRDKSFNMKMPDVEPEIQKALACIDAISKTEDPLVFSLQDDLLKDVENIKDEQVKLYDTYNKPDIFLHTRVQTQGLENNLGDSVDDFTENNRLGYSVGASINFALGSEEKTKKAKVRAQRSRYQAQKARLMASLNQTHTNMKRTVVQLMEILQSQKVSNQALNNKLKVLRKKYKQARISLVELTVEQDKQINTELAIIDTRLAVLNNLFQYFDLYTETPCVFNKAKS